MLKRSNFSSPMSILLSLDQETAICRAEKTGVCSIHQTNLNPVLRFLDIPRFQTSFGLAAPVESATPFVTRRCHDNPCPLKHYPILLSHHYHDVIILTNLIPKVNLHSVRSASGVARTSKIKGSERVLEIRQKQYQFSGSLTNQG